MCGIFLLKANKSKKYINKNVLKRLATLSMRRGQDSSGLLYYQDNHYHVFYYLIS